MWSPPLGRWWEARPLGDFCMPVLGADMDAGTIVEWRVEQGDVVHRGDIVAVVDTDKSTIEVEVFEDGVVDELLIEPGVEVAVGTPLARLRAIGAPATLTVPPAPAPVPATGMEASVIAPPAVTAPPMAAPLVSAAEAPAFVRASPMARRAAARDGIDLHQVTGTGPGGAVIAPDLDGGTPAATSPPPSAPPTPEQPARRLDTRRAVGALMARSAREIPHYYLATTIDLRAASGWLADQNADRPVTERVLPAAVLFRAVARAAGEISVVNGTWTDDAFHPSTAVHLGVAVSLRGGGLVAPAIADADQLDVDQLMTALRGLVQRARAGALRSSDLTDPTITITNLGDQGVDEVYGVIYPPQVALVGFGKINERPWAADGMLGVRPVIRATLSADHRASDGHEGARFLARIDQLLQSPEDL